MAILDSLADVITSFALPGGAQVERRMSTGRDEFGEDEPTVVTTLSLDPVVIQPLEGRDLLKVPEGDRDRERILIHSCERLRTAQGGSDKAADVVLYDPTGEGEIFRYIVETAEPWVRQAGMWRCRARKEEGDA